MTWTRRRIATAMTGVVTVAWALGYAAVTATAEQPPAPVTAVAQLVVPPLLWVALLQIGSAAGLAARLALHRRRSTAVAHRSAMDPAGQVLAAVVAALPERRREWGKAMLGELAEVRGRSARWRFALSCGRATLRLPPASGWPVFALVTGAVVASAAAVGPAVGRAVPGLTVFAVTFTGLVGAMVILAVARSRRLRLPPVPVPTILVIGGVAASITATVIFLRQEPAAARHLPAAAAVYLAAVLTGCLWIAVAPPRWLGTNRLAPHLGAAAAVVFTAWSLLLFRLEPATEPSFPLMLVLTAVLVSTPFAVFVIPAFTAGRAGRSLRSGLQAAVWTVITMMPLTYALMLPEALRRHAIDGRTLDGELVAPVGVNLPYALVFCLGIFPVFGLTLGAVGAALGAGRTLSSDPARPDGHPTP